MSQPSGRAKAARASKLMVFGTPAALLLPDSSTAMMGMSVNEAIMAAENKLWEVNKVPVMRLSIAAGIDWVVMNMDPVE